METITDLERIIKLRQRLFRLITLGESNQLHSSTPTNHNDNTARSPIDFRTRIEECVRRLFSTLCSVETFIQDVQRILNVTIKSNLILFLVETIPLAQQYLRQHQYDPFSWDTFKMIALQPSAPNAMPLTSDQSTRLPSLQQAHFRLPPACPQLIDLTSSSVTGSTQEETFLTPYIRPDANLYQQKLINRFARHNFYLNECGEQIFLQTLYAFLRYIIRRLRFFTQHRTDTHLLDSDTYEMTSNTREQIRFLIELNKKQNGEFVHHLNIDKHQRRTDLTTIFDEDQKRIQARENRLSIMEALRQKEADETACLVLRESRLKRQKLSDNQQKIKPIRILRSTLQDLVVVMENEPILKRSKTLLYAYANR